VLPFGLLAQIKIYPHERAVKKSVENGRVRTTQTAVPLLLPFWDDFSFTPEGENPLGTLWIESSMVTVSGGQAILPPSFNVATFDGLDASGIPYNPNPGDEQVFGYRDTLVSQPIRLDLVALNQRDSVYLSFYFQAGGNGEPPDQADFLRVELKDDNNEWHEAITLTIDDAPDPAKFYNTLIHITADTLFHDGFQFRFISFGRKSGRYDSWHIDYVFLNDQRHANDIMTPDRTLSQPPGPIFGDYYAMPIEHFFKAPALTAASFFTWNLFKETVYEYNTDIKSVSYYKSAPPDEHEADLDIQETVLLPKVPAFSVNEAWMVILPVIAAPLFNSAADHIKITITVGIDSADNLPPEVPTDYSPKYAPIDFRLNDTLRVDYFLDSAYAYDDGTAEYSAGLVRSGNELAYRFGNIHPGQDSILNGVLFYFPSFAGSPNATSIRFFVMNEVDGKPGSILYEDLLTIDRTTDNVFSVYELLEGIILKGPFYIAYREPSTGSVRIGLDKSNNTGNQMYFRGNSTSSWILNDEVTGSLMIRPTFGPHPVVVTGVPEEIPTVSIFPNPNRGEFYIKGPVSDVQLLSAAGESVPVVIENMEDRIKVNVSTNPVGVYIVRYKTAQQVQTRKILLIR
jgi:hypothetical protein